MNKEDPEVRTALACVVDAVARYYGVGTKQVYGRSRSKTVALARSISMYLVRMTLGYSYPEIAGLFGCRDPSTILSAVRKITTLRVKDEVLDAALDVLRSQIIESQGKEPAIGTKVSFPDKVWDKLQALLDTGLFGGSMNDVIVRLVSSKVYELTKEDSCEKASNKST